VLAIADAVPRGGSCEVFARIATLDLTHRRVLPVSATGEWRTALQGVIPATAGFVIGRAQDGIAPCMLGGERIHACDVDTRPRKTWWRRTDAE
jgi:hypothetical protein